MRINLGLSAPLMKVLAVTNMLPTPESPNAGRFIEQQIRALQRAGLELEVVLVNRQKEGMGAYVGLRGMLKGAVRRFNPDLIHVMYGGIMPCIVRYAIRDRPVVVTFHGSDLLGQPFERPVRRILSACGVLASRRAARQCDGVVAVAQHLVDKLPKEIPRWRIQIIPCGIDLSLFTPGNQRQCREQLGWAQDNFHVLFQATGDPVKRPELAAAAVDRLRELGVKTELHYLRGVEYEHVPIWLNASDVLLVTSHHEGSPTIVKEALACNLPIVSVRVGDIPQRIQEIAGCHLSLPNATELALMMQKVQMSSGKIAGHSAVKDISLESCARQLLEFYKRIYGVRHD